MSTHSFAVDADCYSCLGTGKVVGFGSSGKPCSCQEVCEQHHERCDPEDDE